MSDEYNLQDTIIFKTEGEYCIGIIEEIIVEDNQTFYLGQGISYERDVFPLCTFRLLKEDIEIKIDKGE